MEREVIPMCRAEGLAIAPWGVLANGRLKPNAEFQKRQQTGEKGRELMWERTPDEVERCQKLEEFTKKIGAKRMTSVAIAYVMHVSSSRDDLKCF
jgi:aryl-alcohol dehydrogenase-like predicted oxidoreductase